KRIFYKLDKKQSKVACPAGAFIFPDINLPFFSAKTISRAHTYVVVLVGDLESLVSYGRRNERDCFGHRRAVLARSAGRDCWYTTSGMAWGRVPIESLHGWWGQGGAPGA